MRGTYNLDIQVLLQVVKGGTYYYKGMDSPRCVYCNNKTLCDKDCLSVVSKQVLGDIWVDEVRGSPKEYLQGYGWNARTERYDRYTEELGTAHTVHCNIYGKIVADGLESMERHRNYNIKCLKLQNKIKE